MLRRLWRWLASKVGPDFLEVPGARLCRKPYYHIEDWDAYLASVSPNLDPAIAGALEGSAILEHSGAGLYLALHPKTQLSERGVSVLAAYMGQWVGDHVFVYVKQDHGRTH